MRHLVFCLLALSAASLTAQTPVTHKSTSNTENILMLSDIHFDPFHDPTLVPQLVKAKVKDWPAILATPTTPAALQAFDNLQKTCNAKGIDTFQALLSNALAAQHTQLPKPLFITVSGDLMAHQFDCRYKTLVPNGSEADYSAFAANTVAYVAQQLHGTFPKSPIYFSLGNNDSGCKDYRETEDSDYLKADGKSFSEVVLDKSNAQEVLKDFSALGDYRVDLPKPFKHTRLLVMQDIFESKKYETCGGKDSATEGKEQIDWLTRELDDARSKHDRVWVMAHIPPGIDAYSTFTKASKDDASCKFSKPTEFLNSNLFADALRDYTDVISLVLLGHTHMDEMRLYTAKSGSGAIPGKLVPSISPVDGNNPSFTVGTVDPDKAILIDYSVYAASNQTGVNTTWALDYTYSTTYNEPDYSAASLTALTNIFLADPQSKTAASQAYESHYFVGGPSAGLNLKAAAMSIVWPIYTCSMTHDHAKSFAACACPSN
jgi:sphingomyelin phosphodiesterase acid-like 3